MNEPAFTLVPAVLHWTDHPSQIYHAKLSLGASPDEILVQFEHPEANNPPITWAVPRDLFTLAREVQPGSSAIVGNFAALTFGPQCLREHGWTQLGPLDSLYTLDLWDPAIGHFFSQLTPVLPGTAGSRSLQLVYGTTLEPHTPNA